MCTKWVGTGQYEKRPAGEPQYNLASTLGVGPRSGGPAVQSSTGTGYRQNK